MIKWRIYMAILLPNVIVELKYIQLCQNIVTMVHS